jgi:hypothetical protein
MQQRIMETITKRGEVYSAVLYDMLYGDDPEGGPDPKIIDIHVVQMNRRLKSWGYAIQRRVPRARDQPWRLVQIAEAAE